MIYIVAALVLWNSWLTWRLYVHRIAFALVAARVARLRQDSGL